MSRLPLQTVESFRSTIQFGLVPPVTDNTLERDSTVSLILTFSLIGRSVTESRDRLSVWTGAGFSYFLWNLINWILSINNNLSVVERSWAPLR